MFPIVGGALLAASVVTQGVPQGQNGRSGESQGSLAPGMTINATLKSSIDTKRVKPNDTVAAETSDKVKSADGRVILPKGAKLMGHVTQAEARSKGDKESMLAIQFDKGTTKDGQEIPLNNVVIQAIAAPATSAPAYSSGPAAGTTSNNPSMSGSTGGRPGSGTTGSSPQNSYPGAAAGQTEGGGEGGSGPLPPNSQGVYGMQDVKLARVKSPNGENSVIISNGKNVHLDSGTRLLLAVQPQGSSETPVR